MSVLQISDNNNKENQQFSRKQQIGKKIEKRKRVKLDRKDRIRKAKREVPDQNSINLSSEVLTSPQKLLLAKVPSFILTRDCINW